METDKLAQEHGKLPTVIGAVVQCSRPIQCCCWNLISVAMASTACRAVHDGTATATVIHRVAEHHVKL